MKIIKTFLIIVMLLCLVGCTNVKELSYDDIINTLSLKEKNANTYKQGYQYYIPKGLLVDDAGSNYAIITSSDATYYLYVDLVNYINKKTVAYEANNNYVYSKKINYQDKSGYVEIKLWENNQYLIEIMYNYAKIEVMVEENLINKVLINSISILNSIKYNDLAIERLLNDDELDYTEEIFEIFENNNVNSDVLEYENESENNETEEELKDTDFIN